MLSPAQVKGIIDTHRKKASKEVRSWDKYRAWYLSEYWAKGDSDLPSGATHYDESDDDINMEMNYPYSYIDTMIANVCPTNPQVSISARRDDLKDAARYRESLANDVLRRCRAHTLLWKTSTQTALCGRGFLKCVWNFRKNSVDFISVDPRHLFFDMSANKWEDIRYLIEVTVLTKQELAARTKKRGKKKSLYNPTAAKKMKFGAYPGWLKDRVRDQSLALDASKDFYEWALVYEVYDFTGDGRYYHISEDSDEPLFEGDLPYKYLKNPFTMLTFNDNMVDLGGLSDVKLIASVQERLNELDTLELWHAQSSIPVMLINSGLVDNPESIVHALQAANTPGSLVRVEGSANAPLGDLIGSTPTTSLQPSFSKMRERAIQVIEFVLGIPQYSRGVVGVSDVATEVALADTATRTRNGRRIKKVEDTVKWMAMAAISMYEELLPEGSDLPVRLTDSTDVLVANRKAMEMNEVNASEARSILAYDYESVAYSPTENNRLIQLRNLNQYLPVLMQAPNVDKTKLIAKLLDLLMMKDLVVDTPQPPGPMAGPPGEAPSEDTGATGALPPGVEEPPQTPLPAGGPGQPAMTDLAGFEGSGLPGT